jgi:hypothetical protein
MRSSRTFIATAVFAPAIACWLSAAGAAETNRPNIVLILADDK